VLFVAAAAVAWSSAGVLTRAIAASAGTQLFWRAFFAGLALLVVVVVQSRGRPGGQFRALGPVGLGVALCFATASSAFMLALGETTVARVLFIQAASPFIAAALAWALMKERVPRRTRLAMTASLVGVGVMLGASLGGGSPKGDLLALLMATAFAAAIVLTRLRRDVSMTPATCLAMLLVAVVAEPLTDPMSASGHDVALLAVFGAGQMCLGLSLFAVGARLIPAGEAGLITVLEVVLGPVWVWIAYAERPDRATLLGGAIVLAAVVLHAAVDFRGERGLASG
jgi:drug/metabolite transporter (DMT)-like permease